MTSARRQLVPLPSNLNTGKGPTPHGHPCFSFRPLEQLKGKTALKGKWAEMNGNDRQNQISPASPSALPSSHLLTRPCAQSDHFFSYDSATTVGPSDQNQLRKHTFQLRSWSDCQLRIDRRRVDKHPSAEPGDISPRYKSPASSLPPAPQLGTPVPIWLKADNRTTRNSQTAYDGVYPDTDLPHFGPKPGHQSLSGSKLRSEQPEQDQPQANSSQLPGLLILHGRVKLG